MTGTSDPTELSLLCPVVAAAATGDGSGLADGLDRALRGCVEPSALREALLMVALFAGFPRALDGLIAFRAAEGRAGREPSEPQPESGLPDPGAERRDLFRRRGRALFERVYGSRSSDVMTGLLRLDPELPGWILEDAYGRVLARPGLGADVRECLAVVQLAALGLCNQLGGHVRGALHCGATVEQVRSALAAAAAWISDENRDAATRALARSGR